MDYLTVALVLIAAGAALLAAEVLMPTGGFLVVGALLFFALGVGTILYYGDSVEAAVALGGMAVGLPAAGFVAVTAWRRMAIGGALDAGDVTAAPSDVDGLKNRVGKTVSPLRPSGTAEFDGRRVEAMTEGTMLDAGVWVRCVAVRGGTAIVRRMDPPADLADLGPDAPARAAEPLDDLDLGLDPK